MFSQGYSDRGLRTTTTLNLLPVCSFMSRQFNFFTFPFSTT